MECFNGMKGDHSIPGSSSPSYFLCKLVGKKIKGFDLSNLKNRDQIVFSLLDFIPSIFPV